MNRAQMESLWQQAQARGLLPADAPVPTPAEARPWPVVLLTALGAWLAAVPLLAVLALTFGAMFQYGGAWLAGVLLLTVAIVILRSGELPLFVEQLSVPLLLTGGASLGFALFHDLPDPVAAGVLALLAGATGVLVRPHWLKTCLGAAAALFTAAIFWPMLWDGRATGRPQPYWLSWHVCAAAWLLTGLRERAAGLRPSVQSLLAGWGAMTLLGLALSSGMAMLVGGSVGVWDGLFGKKGLAWADWPGGVSAVLTLLAAAWLGHAWPSLRRWPCAGVAVVAAALAGFMPALGAVLLMGVACLLRPRWPLAALAGLAAVWIVSAFYYQLSWPLAIKAAVLAAAGVLLGLLAWPLWRRGSAAEVAETAHGGHRHARIGAAVSLAALLLVINFAIAQKETLIADGQPVFLPLAPADPRSLMQGDFMQLNFALPDGMPRDGGPRLTGRRPHVVARLDERRVARLLRLHAGEALRPDELLIELTPRSGRWTVVTDAWFFKEGEAPRWAAARFGEFRVTPDGRALLVGLRGDALAPL